MLFIYSFLHKNFGDDNNFEGLCLVIYVICVLEAVAVVRLLRIEKGKAFVDLLNKKANDSGEKEIGYVERTLGFSTRYLEDRDIRLVKVIYCTWWIGGCICKFLFIQKACTKRLIKVTYSTYLFVFLLSDFNLSQKAYTFGLLWDSRIIYLQQQTTTKPFSPKQKTGLLEWQPYIPSIFNEHRANHFSVLFVVFTYYY